MCKHCKISTVNERCGEKTNDAVSIGKIKDGSQTFELTFNRYIFEEDKIHKSDLLLELTCDVNGYTYPVKSKTIKIKYCPFCGEEL